MSHRPRLLVVTYHFPPGGGVSVQRILSFVRHLPQNGFAVDVLTTRNGAYPVYDPDLLQLVPPDVKVFRSFTPELPFHIRKHLWHLTSTRQNASVADSARPGPLTALRDRLGKLFCPDPQVVWVPRACQKAKKLIRRQGIEAVLITAPPFSGFLIGLELKRAFPGIFLAADFRDEWLEYYLGNVEALGSEYKRTRCAEIERNLVSAADLIVTTTRATLHRMRSRYSEQRDSKFVWVPNGFESDRIPLHVGTLQAAGRRMVVTYVGTVYRPCSPRYYLEAVAGLPPEVRDNIETHFIGRVTREESRILAGTSAHIRLLGFKPQQQALDALSRSDCALVIVDDDVSIAGKTFEYLGMGVPILALTPQGSETAHLLQQTGGGLCADSRDVPTIRRAILALFEMHRSGQPLPRTTEAAVRPYQRPRTAELLAQYLHAGLEALKSQDEPTHRQGH